MFQNTGEENCYVDQTGQTSATTDGGKSSKDTRNDLLALCHRFMVVSNVFLMAYDLKEETYCIKVCSVLRVLFHLPRGLHGLIYYFSLIYKYLDIYKV